MRSTYVGLYNTIGGVLIVVLPFAGRLLEATAFPVLFIASLSCAVLCLATTFTLSPANRRR